MAKQVTFSNPLVSDTFHYPAEPWIPDDERDLLMTQLRLASLSLDTMKSAVVNVQGYRIENGSFIIKELGVCFPELNVGKSYFFKPPLHQTITPQREAYNRQWLHRLPFSGGILPYSSLVSVLKGLSKRRQLYAKGHDQCVILSQLGFYVIDLEHVGCPRADRLPDVAVTCPLADHKDNLYCAERRSLKFGLYLKDQIK